MIISPPPIDVRIGGRNMAGEKNGCLASVKVRVLIESDSSVLSLKEEMNVTAQLS